MNAFARLVTCVSYSGLGAFTLIGNVMLNDSGKYPEASGIGMLASTTFVTAGASAIVVPQYTRGLIATGFILQSGALILFSVKN